MAEMLPSVLVVEDELAQREVLVYNLENDGFRVIKAGDGNEALLLILSCWTGCCQAPRASRFVGRSK